MIDRKMAGPVFFTASLLLGVFSLLVPGSPRPAHAGEEATRELRAIPPKASLLFFVSYRSSQPLLVSPTEIRFAGYRLLSEAMREKGLEVGPYEGIEPLVMNLRIRSDFDFGADLLRQVEERFSSDHLLVARMIVYSDRILLMGRSVNIGTGLLEWAGTAERMFSTDYEERPDSLDEDWGETMGGVVRKLADSWEASSFPDGSADIIVMPVMTAGGDHGQADIATYTLLRSLVESRQWRVTDPAVAVRFLRDRGFGPDFLVADARRELTDRFGVRPILVPRLIAYGKTKATSPGVYEEDDFLPPARSTREPYFFTLMVVDGALGNVTFSAGEFTEGRSPVGLFGVMKTLSIQDRFVDSVGRLVRSLEKHLEG